jgi:hypothetical protein
MSLEFAQCSSARAPCFRGGMQTGFPSTALNIVDAGVMAAGRYHAPKQNRKQSEFREAD